MKRLKPFRPMLFFALFLQMMIGCSKEELAFTDDVQQDIVDETPVEQPSQPEEEPTDSTANSGDNDQLKVPDEVIFWKDLFDQKWHGQSGEAEYSKALDLSLSKNLNQEYYYLGYYIDGLTSIWRATGDMTYLDFALELINNTLEDAVPVGNGFLGWLSADGQQFALWDSFYWRHVATLIRVMGESSEIMASSKYKAEFEKLLSFSEKNIWDRYQAMGEGNFYRSRTHMASHWARIGMELFKLTNKPKYYEVFQNISEGTMPGYDSNLKNQLFHPSGNSTAIVWDKDWGVQKGSSIQDTSHGGAIVSFWVNAYENGLLWDMNHLQQILETLNEIIWKEEYGSEFTKNVDGTGGEDLNGRLHEWLTLGRLDRSLQDRIRSSYVPGNSNFFGCQILGIAALNEAILINGTPFFSN